MYKRETAPAEKHLAIAMLTQAIQDAFVAPQPVTGGTNKQAVQSSAVAWLKGNGAELSADVCAQAIGFDLKEIREQL